MSARQGLLQLKPTVLYERMIDSNAKVKILEGGGRSGKTWQTLMYILFHVFLQNINKGMVATCGRAKMTWIRDTVIRDFAEICMKYDVPVHPKINFNRMHQTYEVYGNFIQFVGFDEPQKYHGSKRDLLWINEAMEVTYEVYRQLSIRTTGEQILDYNPSALTHWIYDRVCSREDSELIHSTMLMNPYLPYTVVDEIMAFEPTPFNIERGTADRTSWEIYGLGKRSLPEGLIFKDVAFAKMMPPEDERRWTVYGLDFGFTNDPTALVEVCLAHGELYIRQLVYDYGLTNLPPYDQSGRLGTSNGKSIHEKFVELKFNRQHEIVADSAEQKSVRELLNAGWNIKGVKKWGGSVVQGIDVMKRYKINVHESSKGLKDEFAFYKWKVDRDGSFTNQPIDRYNHAIDAVRYAVMDKLGIKPMKVGMTNVA